MKTSIFFSSLATSLLLTSAAVAAPAVSPSPSSKAETTATRVAVVKAKADAAIPPRLQSLNELMSKVNASTHLSSSQKASITAEIQGQITALTALQAKIDADTDLATIRADYSSLYNQHYIYAFYVPRIHRIAAADAEIDSSAKLTSLAGKLQSYITLAQQQGNNVTALQTALTDLQSKTADATTQATNAENSLLALSATSYPGSKGTLDSTNQALQAGRNDLKTARLDVNTIIAGLKKIFKNIQ